MTPTWLGDSSGFVYAVYPPADSGAVYSSANVASKLLLHTIGTRQEEDRLLFHRPDQPGLYVWPWVDRDAGWLVAILADSEADSRAVWACDLGDPSAVLHELVPASTAEWTPVGADERGFILWTDLDADVAGWC